MSQPRTRTGRRLAVLSSVLVLASCSSKEGGTAATTPPLAPMESSAPLPSPLPAVAARVNGADVTSLNVALYARQLIARGTFKKEERPRAMRASLDHLIDRELLLQEALRRGLAADEAALSVALDAARAGHGTEAAWTAFLAEQGTDPASFRRELRIQKTIEALLRQAGDVAVLTGDLRTRGRIERFY